MELYLSLARNWNVLKYLSLEFFGGEIPSVEENYQWEITHLDGSVEVDTARW